MLVACAVRRLLPLVFLAFCLPWVAGAEPAAADPNSTAPAVETPKLPEGKPSDVIDRLHAVLLDVMKNAETLGYEGRRKKLEPVLADLFDIAYMAQKSVGRHWKRAGEEDRGHLIDTFTRFTVANYAGRFNGYSGQSFETFKEEPSLRGTILVHSRLIENAEESVQLNYRLRPVGDRWKIIDVYLNGTVSEIALRRSEYSSLIQREGFAALLSALDEKIVDLASEVPSDQS